MFIWARIPDRFEDSLSFTRDLLEHTGILVTPGSAFGKLGKRYVRLALVVSSFTIRQAAKRLVQTGYFMENEQ